jgi:delta8-fatty-acid desaturase
VHDLAHRYVTADSKFDYAWAIMISNLLGGTSVGWWKHNHNTHHVATNDPVDDPDI